MFESKPKKHKNAKLKSGSYVLLFATLFFFYKNIFYKNIEAVQR